MTPNKQGDGMKAVKLIMLVIEGDSELAVYTNEKGLSESSSNGMRQERENEPQPRLKPTTYTPSWSFSH